MVSSLSSGRAAWNSWNSHVKPVMVEMSAALIGQSASPPGRSGAGSAGDVEASAAESCAVGAAADVPAAAVGAAVDATGSAAACEAVGAAVLPEDPQAASAAAQTRPRNGVAIRMTSERVGMGAPSSTLQRDGRRPAVHASPSRPARQAKTPRTDGTARSSQRGVSPPNRAAPPSGYEQADRRPRCGRRRRRPVGPQRRIGW
jgi:hypothetical protein